MRKSALTVPVQSCLWARAPDCLLQAIAQPPGPAGELLPLRLCEPECRCHTHDSGDVLRTGAPLPLLAPAGELLQERHTAAHEEEARALGAAELVPRERQQVDAERVHIQRMAVRHLDGVRVHGDPPAKRLRRVPHGPCDLGQRLHRSNLVIGVAD